MRYLEGHRRASTVFRQTSIIQAHILPALADRPLAETSVEELEELVDRICAGKSAQTKKHFISYLSDIFRRALKKGLIAANPVDRIDRPRVVKKDQLVLTEAEARKLLAHLRENYPVMFYHAAIALHTLCRAGELRALTWADIDWEGRQLSVSKTRDVKTGLKFRTKNSETRKIPINDELLAILKELRSQTFSAPSDPILPVWREFASGDQGKPLKIVCKSLQLPEIRFHDLRASGITILLLKGVPAPKVMLLAGHRRLSSIQHYLRASGREAVGATDCLQLLDEDITPGIAPTSSDPPSDNFTPVPPDNVVKPEES
jgi:integrase